MQRFYEIVRDINGNPAASVSFTVYLAGTSNLATLYVDNGADVPSTILSNPIVTGSDGRVAFAANDGDYDFVLTGSNFTPLYRYRVNFFDGTTATVGSQSSFSLSMPGEFSVAGSPGAAITVTKAVQNKNLFWASDPTANGVAPTFRALAAADGNTVFMDLTTVQTANGNKTWGGTQTYNAVSTFNAAVTIAGGSTLSVSGNTTLLSNLILEKTSKIQVNTAAPDFPYKSAQFVWASIGGWVSTVYTDTINQLKDTGAANLTSGYMNLDFPYDYESGSDVYLEINWSTTGTNTGVCRWGLEYSIIKAFNQGAFPASTTQFIEIASPGVVKRVVTTESTVITGTNFEPGTQVALRVFRDGAHVNDTLTDQTFLHSVCMRYKASRPGTKNRSVPFYV